MIPFIESAKDEILAKIDTLKTTIDRLISSSQSNNPNIALGNLSNKIDALKQDVGTKSSQVTVNKVSQDLDNIASIITSKIGTVETKVNQTNTTLATKANQNTVDAVASNVNSVLALARQGAVKRVQRGTIDHLGANTTIITKTIFKENGTEYTVRSFTVTLPYSVDINKSIATCEWARFSIYNYPYVEGVNCQLTGNNKITFKVVFNEVHGTSLKWMALYNISWQVVEYY